MKRWGSSNDLFYLDEFYDGIVVMFEQNAESSWVEETIKWWNMQVFYFILMRISYCLSSQVPGLRSKSGQKTMTRRQPKTSGPTPAERIAAQLARQVPKPPAASRPEYREDMDNLDEQFHPENFTFDGESEDNSGGDGN